MKKGVHLPRLDTAERDALIPPTSADSIAAKGLAVFNTTTNCYNVWSGKQWLSLCDADMNPLRITTQPAPFTWRRKQDDAGDPNGPATPDAVTLTVVASGSGTLTYAWYEKPQNKNITTHGAKLGSEASYTPDITAWGMHTYYCVVSNSTDSVVSNYADVAVGCGAKTTDGNWLSFMCYNLGADTTLDPFVYYSKHDSCSFDIKGWLFQWGRVADGHQWRGAARAAGPWVDSTRNQVPSGNATFYGKFISTSSAPSYHDWARPPYAKAWSAYKSADDPCPAGWVVPTVSDYASIVAGTDFAHTALAAATANTLVSDSCGCAFQPDGTTTTLYFPCVGQRLPAGNYSHFKYATFWASMPSGVFSPFVEWQIEKKIYVSSMTHKANAFSVRCVKYM
jgi:uncharacterized protein (TIGR02145 family)